MFTSIRTATSIAIMGGETDSGRMGGESPMAIAEGYKHNFEQLQRAFSNGDIALLEVTEKASGNPAVVIVAVNFDGRMYDFVPMARMFDGSPDAQFDPPASTPPNSSA
jgi:hypothetical protein